ncbi:SRPBCC family protein [Streptacidiphilus pinicola]|uniref:SRPBCC family protein n=1 Tax=Streptacidiphilus pinicola TaxID=2219663 RepID=A0A2X0JI20_9ACTN|nr:SRPBCC family protein [Streptacidiphilus pinicola]RAG87338.1 SRPBCC family protein [Streptacidiphilus pinicola]
MAVFLLSRRSRLGPVDTWERLTDWSRHGERIPFTDVGPARGTGRAVGDVVLARTALGPVGFDDPMEIVVLTPPTRGREGLCRLEKRGRIVRGWAELRVCAEAEGGAEALWVEEIRVRGVPAALDPLVARVARLVFGRALDGLLGPEPAAGHARR